MNYLKRYILLIIGFVFYCIGVIGYILPGLPGTIFIILAALCFLSSNQKYYNRIVSNKQYGAIVKEFIEFRVIPQKIKIIILFCIWLFSLLSIFYFLYYKLLYYKLIILILAAIGSVVVINAKEKK